MSEPMSKEAREELYTDFLRAEGYLPDLEKDGSVVFEKGDKSYVVVVDDDAEFFQVMAPIWKIHDEAERVKARRAAHEVMGSTKVAKLYVYEDDICVAVELFCIPPEAFKRVFGRCMASLEYAREQFVKRMKA